MRRILVCGSRDFLDYDAIHEAIKHELNTDTIIIQGGAPGADTLASQIAKAKRIHTAQVDALWSKFGGAAGPLRNAAMLGLEPHKVYAFYTDKLKSKGTANMVKQAKKANIEVWENA